jgi:hypothetical protein
MSDIDRIKDRIRKLMAYANDGAASEAEIENAMGHAARLIDAHHIDASEVQPGAEAQPDNLTMGDAFATSQATRFSTWENILAFAVAELFGCVKWYTSNDFGVIRVSGMAQTDKKGEVRRGRRICFYGPVVESREAAELFEEWSRSIATMGVVRWGGCFRGDGAMYCLGFARALCSQALKLRESRELIRAKAPASLAGPQFTAITLVKRYDLIKKDAERWLKQEKGVHLCSGGGRSGYTSGSADAYNEGKSHGSATTFARNNRRKELPSY